VHKWAPHNPGASLIWPHGPTISWQLLLSWPVRVGGVPVALSIASCFFVQHTPAQQGAQVDCVLIWQVLEEFFY